MYLKLEGYEFARALSSGEFSQVNVLLLHEGGTYYHYLFFAPANKLSLAIWTDDPTNYSGVGRSMLMSIIREIKRNKLKLNVVGTIRYDAYSTLVLAFFKAMEGKQGVIKANADNLISYIRRKDGLIPLIREAVFIGDKNELLVFLVNIDRGFMIQTSDERFEELLKALFPKIKIYKISEEILNILQPILNSYYIESNSESIRTRYLELLKSQLYK